MSCRNVETGSGEGVGFLFWGVFQLQGSLVIFPFADLIEVGTSLWVRITHAVDDELCEDLGAHRSLVWVLDKIRLFGLDDIVQHDLPGNLFLV